MDGNKDDALKCLKIGKEALEIGDKTRALKFINKALRLDPTLQIDEDLLSNDDVEKPAPDISEDINGGSSETASPKKPSNQPSIRRRVSENGSSSSSSSLTYSEEQDSMVKEIRKKKDYYEILRVEKYCTVEDVRKAYRKLSLKVHPDKNKAPGADEAFKSVSKAFQCLSNEESRRNYDLVGSDEPVYERQRQGRRNGFNGYYDVDIDPDEIFRNFFYGGMPPNRTTQFRSFSFGPGMGPRNEDHRPATSFNIRMLIQFLPVLLILLLSLIPSSEPIYALSRSYPYEHRFTTQKGVNYYVRSTKFEEDYPAHSPNRVGLEKKVESEYVSILAQNCRHEVQRRQWGFVRETPHCDMLEKFQSAAY